MSHILFKDNSLQFINKTSPPPPDPSVRTSHVPFITTVPYAKIKTHCYNNACANPPELFVSSCCLLSCTVGLFMVSSCFDEWPFGRPHAPFAILHLTTFPPFYIQRYLTQSLISGMLLWKPRLAGVWSRDVGSQSWRSMPLTHKDLPLFLLYSSPSQHLMQRQVHNTS